MKKPPVSIIILNWNGLPDTLQCLRSLRKTTYPNVEVIVVDNGSENNEAVKIKEKFGDFVSAFRLRKNRGFTGGNNWAISKAKGKYVVLLNNDTTVKKDWLDSLIEVVEDNAQIAVAQPKIRLMREKTHFDYAGAAGGFIDRYGYPFTQGRIFDTLEEDKGQYDRIREIFWASGSAMIIRRGVVDKVGRLFDKPFFNYMEEIDFCWRIWNAGLRVVIVPKAVVYHKVASSAKRNLLRKRFWEHRNNLLLLIKNLPKEQFFPVLPVRFLLELITYFYYLISGQFRYASSLFAAHLDFLRLAPSTLRSRKEVSSRGNPPIYSGSIVIDYFLKMRKYFWELNWGDTSGERTAPGVAYLTPAFAQHQRAYQFCLKYMKGQEVLDAGCGSGAGTFLLSQKAKRVVGIDNDVRAIQYARVNYRRKNLSFKAVDILDFNLNSSFDAVISLQVIEHVQDPRPYLLKIVKVLKPGGIAIFSTPNKITQSYNENPYHIREYSAPELKNFLARHFKKVKLYGLHGDKKIREYEKERKRQVMRIMRVDKLKIRRFLPRRVKILLFELFIPIVRKAVAGQKGSEVFGIKRDNFFIKKSTAKAIDLIAICKK